jgi:hypothetical protein
MGIHHWQHLAGSHTLTSGILKALEFSIRDWIRYLLLISEQSDVLIKLRDYRDLSK